MNMNIFSKLFGERFFLSYRLQQLAMLSYFLKLAMHNDVILENREVWSSSNEKNSKFIFQRQECICSKHEQTRISYQIHSGYLSILVAVRENYFFCSRRYQSALPYQLSVKF